MYTEDFNYLPTKYKCGGGWLVLAGVFTRRTTTPTACVILWRTSLTPSVPRSSRHGEGSYTGNLDSWLEPPTVIQSETNRPNRCVVVVDPPC